MPTRLTKPIRGTVCHRIFNDGLPCMTRRLFTISDREAELSGIRSSGNRHVDEGMLNQIVHVTLPLADIIDIRQSGGEVLIEKPEHRKLALELLEAHMTNWARVAISIHDPMNTMPIDDLHAMHEFQMELAEMHDRDRLEEDRQAFRKANLWGESLGEIHSYLRIERGSRGVRSSLDQHTVAELDLPEDAGAFGRLLETSRNDLDRDDSNDLAFEAYRRPQVERPSAYHAIQELIKGRQS